MLPTQLGQALAGPGLLHRRHDPLVGLADHPAHCLFGLFQARVRRLGHQVVEDDAVVLVVGNDAAPGQERADVILQPADAVVVGCQEDQAVLLEAGLVAALLQDLGRAVDGQALAALAEGRVGRQHHQAQCPVVGYVAAVGEDVYAAEHTAGEAALHALADGREHVFLVLEAALALFHLAPQVGPRVEPEPVVGLVEVMQPVAKPAQRILEQSDLLPGLNDAEHHAFEFQATHQLVRGAGRTAQEHGPRCTAAGLHAAEASVLVLDLGGLGAFTVHVAFEHRVPALRQVVDDLVAHIGVVQRQAARHDQRVVVAVLPQAVDHLGHHLQHATRALEVVQRGPVLVEPVEHFGVDGVGVDQALEVPALLCLLRKVIAVGGVEVREGVAHGFHGQLVVD